MLVYQTALECAVNDDLRKEWEEYLEQTENHVEVLTATCEALGLDPGERTPGCQVVQHVGKSLVQAMKMALAAGNPDAAELVACECVVLAETKDHADWELIGACAKAHEGEAADRSCARLTKKSKTRKTSTCTTPKAGAASSGSNLWTSLRRFRRRKKSAM